MSESGSAKDFRGAAVFAAERRTAFLHDRRAAVYNPSTGASLAKDGPACAALRRLEAGDDPAAAATADTELLAHVRLAPIREPFGPKGWEVKAFKIRSRPSSGTYLPEPPPKKRLRGCELMGSRPFGPTRSRSASRPPRTSTAATASSRSETDP